MKLSIITVNLNNRDGLQRTIDSVICQTFRDFEWIVIDGGSTDGSKELIEQYAEHFSYWVSEPDKGIYNAMNKGIKVAKGEYLQFLNSGDSLYSANILEEIPFSSNADIIYGKSLVHDTNGDVFEYGPHYVEFTPFSLVYSTISHPSSFVKHSLFDKIGSFDESFRIAADLDFFYRAIICFNVTTHFCDCLFTHFAGGGISMTNSTLAEEEQRKVVSKYLPTGSVADYQKFVLMLKEEALLNENKRAITIYNQLHGHWLTRKITHFLYRLVK